MAVGIFLDSQLSNSRTSCAAPQNRAVQGVFDVSRAVHRDGGREICSSADAAVGKKPFANILIPWYNPIFDSSEKIKSL